MKVAGLNNQSFQQTASKASSLGKSSQGKSTSFESLLGEAQDQDGAQREQSRQDGNPTLKQSDQPVKPSAQRSAPRTESQPLRAPVQQVNAEQSSQTNEEDADLSADSLPNGQNAPALGTPGLSDRAGLPTQLNPANLNPMASPGQPTISDDAANTLTRRVVWNDFLRKMNDLGVSAEDVLKAFGSLSEKDLAQPPEQSLDKIVAALGLNGPQAAQAKQYFSELITKTKSKSLGEEISASHKQLSLTLASQRDLRRKAQLKSIDNLNNNFFMNKIAKPQAQGEQPQTPLGPDGKPMAAPIAMPDGQDALAQMQLQQQPLTADNALPKMDFPNGIPQPRTQAAEMNGLVEQMQAQAQSQTEQMPVEDKKSVDQLIKNFTARTATKAAPELTMAQAAAGGATASGMQSIQTPSAHASGEAARNALNAILSGGKSKDDDAAAGDGDDQSGSQNIGSTLLPEQRMNAAQADKLDFQSAMGARAQQPQQMAVPELVEQAHIMVREGGGDMKVTLHPDGLGEVALRVSVTDGKVNVQMITESDEAKKLIERSIGDLKSGLSQNHLQVDSIKVDTATNLGKQLEQQYHDAQRQQTQAQWEQFRQDNGGSWRRSFFDTGVVNPYRSQGDAPRDTTAPATAARARSTGGSRRLDLVA